MTSMIILEYQKGCSQACRYLHVWRMWQFLPHIVKTQKHSREVMLHSRQSGSLPHRILSSREEDSYPTSPTSCDSGHCRLQVCTRLPGAARHFCCQPQPFYCQPHCSACSPGPHSSCVISVPCCHISETRKKEDQAQIPTQSFWCLILVFNSLSSWPCP